MNVRTLIAFATLALPFAAGAQLAPLPAPPRGVNPSTPTIKAQDDQSLTGETPLDSKAIPDPADISANSSPLDAQRRGLYLPAGTPISLRLTQPASSGSLKNGQLLSGTLLTPVRNHAGTLYPRGTVVKVTVVSSAPAGKIQSAGVLSVQVERVGTTHVITNVLEFDGKEGHKDVADAAPAKGSEATIPQTSTLNFKVLGPGDTPAPDRKGDQSTGSAPSSQGQPQSTPAAQSPTSGNTTPAPQSTTPH